MVKWDLVMKKISQAANCYFATNESGRKKKDLRWHSKTT